MRHLDEGTIHAWLDGALSSDEAARAEAHVASCTVCAEAVAEARGLIAASSRILLALDNVPNIQGVQGVQGAQGVRWGRRSLATWLVRERIAAVVTLVVAGGALAAVLSRDTPQASRVDLASEPMQTFELAAADSPTPPPMSAAGPQKDGQTLGAMGRGAPSSSRARDVAVARQADSAPASVPQSVARVVTTQNAGAPPARTDDTLRSIAIAQAQREEAQEFSAEAKSSVGEKLADALPRRRAAADASARFAEPRAAAPRALEPTIGGAVGAAATGDTRLVQEERMTEGAREVRRRIYRVDGILVTLDERLPSAVDEAMRARSANAAPAAPAPPADSVARSTSTIRWTDARGAELTLTGPASPERLERIRKLLGY